ncbi:MAG TPA: hypothetical protein VH370_23470 [Humisphaera sp.]|jgi:hypothetical protein|nr:hypothetical protein [Humisphaera sp.]
MSEESGPIDFEDKLRRYRRAETFMPFEIVLSTGDRYKVTDRFRFAMGGDTVLVLQPRVGSRFFHKNQIVAVNELETA